jgi:prepilin-type N-terminal cleavage/methylation domain-containing protein
MINMKKGFTLVELLVVITIIGILSSLGLSTFTTAQIKSRDAKRKAHLRQMADTFEAYFNDYKKYPDSADGSIDGFAWGSEFVDAQGTVYMVKLPTDPVANLTYYYESLEAGKKFQLYAYLENTEDPMKKTLTGPLCGVDKICNYGVASTNITPEEGRQ